MNKFHGTGVALVTPLDQQNKVDWDGLDRLLKYTAGNGVNFFVVNGTTGESATTSKVEKAEILDFVRRNNQNLPIVYGHGGNNTQQLLDDLNEINFDGVDALLSVSPYYNKPSQKGLIGHFTALADASPVPLILYNVPGRTSSNLNASTQIELSRHPNIIGTKEASGDLEQCAQIANQSDPDFLLLSGDDLLTLPILAVGGVGVISVLANGLPAVFCHMVDQYLDGQWKEAREALYKLLEINPLMYHESNPVGIKQVLKELGVCGNEVRLPLSAASPELQKTIRKALESLGESFVGRG